MGRYLLTEDVYALHEFSSALCSLDAEGALEFVDLLAENLDYDGITHMCVYVVRTGCTKKNHILP